jgi:hypothetical protein
VVKFAVALEGFQRLMQQGPGGAVVGVQMPPQISDDFAEVLEMRAWSANSTMLFGKRE